MLLAGCSKTSQAPSTAPVYYTDGAAIQLLPTSAALVQIDGPQHIDGEYGDRTFSTDAWVRINDTIVDVLLFSGFGTTLGELVYNGDSVSFTSSVMSPGKLKTEYVIADMQLSFYDFALLKKHLAQFGFNFSEESTNGITVRRLTRDKDVIATIEKSDSTVVFRNQLRKYSYSITIGKN